MSSNLRKFIFIGLLLVIAGGLLWWFMSGGENATKAFTGKIKSIEGSTITLYGKPTYGQEYEKSYAAEELEVKIYVSDKTKFNKSVLDIPTNGKTYDPSTVNRITIEGSLAELQGQEIILEVESSFSVYGKSEFKAKTITYYGFR